MLTDSPETWKASVFVLDGSSVGFGDNVGIHTPAVRREYNLRQNGGTFRFSATALYLSDGAKLRRGPEPDERAADVEGQFQ